MIIVNYKDILILINCINDQHHLNQILYLILKL